jgi:hypothetical protein
LDGKFIFYMFNVRSRSDGGSHIWMEHEIKCQRYRRFLPDAGRTGKGAVQFWAAEGGHRTIDVEDIISVSFKAKLA